MQRLSTHKHTTEGSAQTHSSEVKRKENNLKKSTTTSFLPLPIFYSIWYAPSLLFCVKGTLFVRLFWLSVIFQSVWQQIGYTLILYVALNCSSQPSPHFSLSLLFPHLSTFSPLCHLLASEPLSFCQDNHLQAETLLLLEIEIMTT